MVVSEPVELRVVAVSPSFASKNSLCQEGFPPQRYQSLAVQIFRVQ